MNLFILTFTIQFSFCSLQNLVILIINCRNNFYYYKSSLHYYRSQHIVSQSVFVRYPVYLFLLITLCGDSYYGFYLVKNNNLIFQVETTIYICFTILRVLENIGIIAYCYNSTWKRLLSTV
jgi:hypothetical protein